MSNFKAVLKPLLVLIVGVTAFVADALDIFDKFSGPDAEAGTAGWGTKLAPYLSVVGYICVGLLAAWFVLQFAKSAQQLRTLKRSLPVLFAKTAHLREQLAAQRLKKYREKLRETVNQALSGESQDGFAKYREKLTRRDEAIFLSERKEFFTESIHALVTDLRAALRRLTRKQDFTVSIQFCVDASAPSQQGLIPLIPVYDDDDTVPKRRIEQETKYLAAGASIGAHCLKDPICSRTSNQHYVFNDLKSAADFHRLNDWPEMRTYIQSLVIAAIKDEQGPFAILQVDAPRKAAFTPEIGHMIECTANALGAFFAVSNFIYDRCLETMALETQLAAAEQEIIELKAQHQKIVEEADEKVAAAALQVENIQRKVHPGHVGNEEENEPVDEKRAKGGTPNADKARDSGKRSKKGR